MVVASMAVVNIACHRELRLLLGGVPEGKIVVEQPQGFRMPPGTVIFPG